MTTPQQPIGSGFGARSTAAEVLASVDLGGRLATVTGGYSGLGLETVRALSGAGATVVVPARRPAHAAEVLAGIERVEVDELDLGDLDSVHGFGRRMLDGGRGVDVLINNAAIMAAPETRVGPGWEAQFATNHLGHFALANLLWPLLAAAGGARVVALSSTGHKLSGIRWDDLMFEPGYDKWQAYGQAKTANSLFAVHLDALGAPAGVRAFAAQDARAGRRDLDMGGDVARANWDGGRLLRGLRHRPTDRCRLAPRPHPGRRCARDRRGRRRPAVDGLRGAHGRGRVRRA